MNAQPNKYPVPFRLKLAAVWREMGFALVVSVSIPIFNVITVTHYGYGHPVAFLTLVLTVLLAIALGYGVKKVATEGSVRYDVDGITVIWAAREYYVPPEMYQGFARRNVWGRFAAYTQDTRALTRGVVMVYEGAEPYDRVRVEGEKVGYRRIWGEVWPWRSLSRVAAMHRLSDEVDGHELRLHCCHTLFPERSEDEHVAWMRSNGMIL